eukprot:TRINITY_DN49876_c0_g1_i1.p2 TRINITY_DN49876_c0_g1~~TRINITY_DN49876_c0_g1_i1.p2  ORF type:complete len:218 (+),score=66.05 TRINITY_DN49876_c0_g1_i1:78-656(+)
MVKAMHVQQVEQSINSQDPISLFVYPQQDERLGIACCTSACGATVICTSVEPEGPCGQLGLRKGAEILSVNGMQCSNPAEVAAAVQAWREGGVNSGLSIVCRLPAATDEEVPVHIPERGQGLGMCLSPTMQLLDIKPGSVACEMGLSRYVGCQLTHVDGEPLSDLHKLQRCLWTATVGRHSRTAHLRFVSHR